MSNELGLGKIITDPNAARDAIHIAVVPMTAGELLQPGYHVRIQDGKAYDKGSSSDYVGIVDPFLNVMVKEGQRFWLYLYPGTVTGMRHHWSHPAFSDADSETSTGPHQVQQLPPTQYPPNPASKWRTPNVVAICKKLLTEGNFKYNWDKVEPLHLLSDELEINGCDDTELLQGLRNLPNRAGSDNFDLEVRRLCCLIASDETANAVKWLRKYSERVNTYDDPEAGFYRLLKGLKGGELYFRGSDLHGLYDLEDADELKENAELFFGINIDWDDFSFSCSC